MCARVSWPIPSLSKYCLSRCARDISISCGIQASLASWDSPTTRLPLSTAVGPEHPVPEGIPVGDHACVPGRDAAYRSEQAVDAVDNRCHAVEHHDADCLVLSTTRAGLRMLAKS